MPEHIDPEREHMSEMARMDEQIAEEKALREELEATYGLVWNTEEVVEDFDVQGFHSPLALVVRKSDDVHGTLRFTHSPRFYFKFEKGWPFD